jgi:hypothetical protein
MHQAHIHIWPELPQTVWSVVSEQRQETCNRRRCCRTHRSSVAGHDGELVHIAGHQAAPVQQHVERLQHVGRVGGIVVGVGGAVARLDGLQEAERRRENHSVTCLQLVLLQCTKDECRLLLCALYPQEAQYKPRSP